jgi:hypothetical protein
MMSLKNFTVMVCLRVRIRVMVRFRVRVRVREDAMELSDDGIEESYSYHDGMSYG